MRVVKAVKQDLCPDCGHWHDHTGRPLVAVIDSQGTEWRIPKGHMPRNNTDDLGGRLYHSDCRNDGILEPARASTEGREDDTRRWTLEGDDESGRAGHITVHGEPLGPGERVRVYERPTEGEETSSGTSDLPANTEGRAVEGGASPSGPSLAEQLRQESLRADAFFRGREVAQARAEREKARADRAEAELARARSDVDAVLRGLTFRRERSRPVFRNKHTGTEVVVLDLAVDDRGGFQGGCRQFTVVTDEPGPPGYKTRGPYSLDSFVQHWEPTGEHVPVDSDRIRERLQDTGA
jgi:hypothetical protein